MEDTGSFEDSKKASGLDMDQMTVLLDALKMAMDPNLEDEEQAKLVEVIQKNRAFILQYAMTAYLNNPKSASLLEGVNQIFGQIEKAVRDDRKERAKKKENEGNRLAFNQMLEAMQHIQDGTVKLPQFDFTDFILDPSKSLLTPEESRNIEPIKDDELVQGNIPVDVNGDRV